MSGDEAQSVFSDLVLSVCEIFSITPVQLFGQRRTRHLALARKALWALARETTALSLPQLGRLTGGRDHTTVLHGLQTFAADCARYPVFAGRVARLRARMQALREDAARDAA